jgi:hypothetical protein
MKKLYTGGTIILLALIPTSAYAAQDAISIASTLLNGIGRLVKTALPIVFGLAILAFFWGIFRYIFSQSMEDKKDGKSIMLWSLIALFIMVSLFGIIQLAQQTFGVDQQSNFNVPTVNSLPQTYPL